MRRIGSQCKIRFSRLRAINTAVCVHTGARVFSPALINFSICYSSNNTGRVPTHGCPCRCTVLINTAVCVHTGARVDPCFLLHLFLCLTNNTAVWWHTGGRVDLLFCHIFVLQSVPNFTILAFEPGTMTLPKRSINEVFLT